MTTATLPVTPGATRSRSTLVLEGALQLARQANLQPASIRRRFRIIGSVALTGVAVAGVVTGAVLFAGSPQQESLRLLIGFVGLCGVALIAAAGAAAGVLSWSVHKYQRLLLLDANAMAAEVTEELEKRRQRIAVFLKAVERAAPDTVAREVDALRRDMEEMNDPERSDPPSR